MSITENATGTCPDCGVNPGEIHGEYCTLAHCQDCNNCPKDCVCGDGPFVAKWMGEWAMAQETKPYQDNQDDDRQSSECYLVNLDDALGNWHFDHLHEIKIFARFDDFENAKRYALRNLKIVVQALTDVVEKVQAAKAPKQLKLYCPALITEVQGDEG